MASKGQKFKKYSDKQKEEILNMYLEGVSSIYIFNEYGIPVGTIKTWARKFRRQGNLKNDIYHNRGKYKRPITLEDYKERYEILKKYQAFLKEQRERK